MIGIEEWICDLLMSRGALVESEENGRIRAMLPAEVAASLGTGEWLSLDLRHPTEQDTRDDDAEWMNRMERLLPAQPLLVGAQFRALQAPAPIDAASVLASGLAIQNGIYRLVEDGTATATYLFFTFQYSIESDDRSAGIASVCINADASSLVPMPENFLLGIRDGLSEDPGTADPRVVERWFPAAVRVARSAARKHVAQVEENANRRLARDTARVESYYAGLLAQLEKRVAKRANDAAAAEKERSRLSATQADRAAKLQDLRRKYGLRVRIEPATLLAARAPVRQISIRLIRKKEERAYFVHWNSVLHMLEPPLCEHCSTGAHPLYLCERVHVLCKNCWAQCPVCSRFFCLVCQPRCKCEAAKVGAV
ncbi:MAG TPA: hypothetical protein VLW65_03055 [Bryobacteraceae bacterium]|nr:hypothetical protein [Bryobacteraceae bacterium]